MIHDHINLDIIVSGLHDTLNGCTVTIRQDDVFQQGTRWRRSSHARSVAWLFFIH